MAIVRYRNGIDNLIARKFLSDVSAVSGSLTTLTDTTLPATYATQASLNNYLPLTGGTLQGDLNMGSNNIVTSGLVGGKDVSGISSSNVLYDLTSVAAGGFSTAPPAPWRELASGGSTLGVASTHAYTAAGVTLTINNSTYRLSSTGLLGPGLQRSIWHRNVTMEVEFDAFGLGSLSGVTEFSRVYAGFYAEGADGFVLGAAHLKLTGSASYTWFGGKAIKNQGSGGLLLGNATLDGTGVTGFKLKTILTPAGVQCYHAFNAGAYVEQQNSGGQTGVHDFRYADTAASAFNSSGSQLHAFVAFDSAGTNGGATAFVRVKSITFSGVS